jgi:hypothetical protein
LFKKTFTALERWLHFFLFFIPMASSIPISLTRYLSVLLLGYVGFTQIYLKFLPTHKIWARATLVLFVASELAWQTCLLVKYFRGEVFFAVS